MEGVEQSTPRLARFFSRHPDRHTSYQPPSFPPLQTIFRQSKGAGTFFLRTINLHGFNTKVQVFPEGNRADLFWRHSEVGPSI